ncbi:MAG: YqiA/YcfP family alpha/beta fold hydrolase [Bacteroidales bacterium]
MKTLYIHGLDSYPKIEKIDILKKHHLDPVALHLNYREKLGFYETLKETAIRKNVKFIVGSSLGGYLGFLLAAELGIPCLLFNPAMEYKEKIFYSFMPTIEEFKSPNCFVVLGEWDKTVNPEETKKTLKEYQHNGLKSKIITCEWLGHEIDLDTFEEMLSWALTSLYLNK